jgi:hypothetical protein
MLASLLFKHVNGDPRVLAHNLGRLLAVRCLKSGELRVVKDDAFSPFREFLLFFEELFFSSASYESFKV